MLTFISRGALLVLIAALPFFIIPSTFMLFASKPIMVLLVMLFLALSVVISDLKLGSFEFPRTHVLTAVVVLFLITIISSALVALRASTIIDIATVDSAAYVFAGLIFLLATVRFFTTLRTVRSVFIATWIGGAILVLFHTIRFLMGPATLNFGIFGNLLSSPLGAWPDVGLFAGFLLVLSLAYHQFLARKRLWVVISTAAIVISALAISVVNINTVWWLVGVSAVLIFVYSFLKMTRQANQQMAERAAEVIPGTATPVSRFITKIPTAPLVIVLVSFAMILISGRASVFSIASNVPGLGFLNNFNAPHIEAKLSPLATLELGWNVIKEGKVFGVGPGQFNVAWNQFKPIEVNNTILWSSDFSFGFSTVLSSLVTLGIPGLLAWIALIAFAAILMFRLLLGTVGEEHERNHGAVLSFSVVYLILIFLFSNPGLVLYTYLFVFLGLLITVALAMGIVRTRAYSYLSDPRAAFASVAGLVLLLLGIIMLGYLFTTQAYARYEVNRASTALAQGNVPEATSRYNRALQFDERDSYYRELISVGLQQLSTFVSSSQNASQSQQQALQEQGQAIVQQVTGIASRAVALNEDSYVNWLSLGDTYSVLAAYKVEGAYDQALAAYDRAQKLSPSNPLIKLALAQLERNNGNVSKAFEYADQAIALKANYTDAYFFKAQLHIQENSIEKAIEAAEVGALTAPTNADAHLQVGILKYNIDDFEGASRDFERALIINPQYANAQYFLALTYRELGRNEEARMLTDILLTTNPENTDVQALSSSLSSGSRAIQAEEAIDTEEDTTGSEGETEE
ncbi:MAG TPA: tetratricopeptide repeat protein [Candidatus Paceibacterota bacterium]|nr:tetratricopeptide repeat protein [Candidatus Paceibacterota bacterium]